VRDREREFWLEDLSDVRATDVFRFDGGHFDNVNGSESSTVTGSHVLVASLNGISAGQLSVLLVHVVGTRAGVVAEPDAKVFDRCRLLLVNLSTSSVSLEPQGAKQYNALC
jgi:hypothetical protein